MPVFDLLGAQDFSQSGQRFGGIDGPEGLFGVLMSTAAVPGFSACSNASKLIWKFSVSAGTTVRCAPVPLTYGWYSGK